MKRGFLAVVLVFLLIYEPPFFRVNVLHILGLLSWLYLFLNHRTLHQVFKLSVLIVLYAVFALIWFYLLVVALANDTPLAQTLTPVYWMLDIIPASLAFCMHFRKKKMCTIDVVNIILAAGVVQGLLSVWSFANPQIQRVLLTRLLAYGYEESYITIMTSFRLFGFASNLTFSSAVVQGVLGALSVYLGVYRSAKYLLLTPLFVFSGVVNARISLVVFIVGLLLIPLHEKRVNFKRIVKMVAVGIVLSAMFLTGASLVRVISVEAYEWIADGFTEISLFFREEGRSQYSYYYYFTGAERYVLPDGFGLWFGRGVRVLGGRSRGLEVSSDVGYVNDVWLGGLFYTVTIYGFFLFMLRRFATLSGPESNLSRFLGVLFCGVLFLANVKGYIFTMNNLTNLFFLLYVWFVAQREIRLQACTM